MIVKGTSIKSRKHAVYLANHLLNANDNEICEVWDIDGHAKPNDLKAAVVDFYDMVNLTRGGKNGLFMISINPRKDEQMSQEQYINSITEAEKRFSLDGQPRAIVRHFKEGRDHVHVVWQTTDTDTRKIKPDIYFYKKKCMQLARDLEIELGHKPVSNQKSFKSYSDKDRERGRIDADQLRPDKRKLFIQETFRSSKDASEFTRKMKGAGMKTAIGKVGVCLIDSGGQVYNLEKELKKSISQNKLYSFFKNEKSNLPTVESLIEKNRQHEKTAKVQSVVLAERKAKYVNFDYSLTRKNISGYSNDNLDKAKKKNDIEKQSKIFRKKLDERKRKRPGYEI